MRVISCSLCPHPGRCKPFYRESFSSMLALQYVTVVRDAATKLSKGTCFACFVNRDDAQRALSESRGTVAILGQQCFFS